MVILILKMPLFFFFLLKMVTLLVGCYKIINLRVEKEVLEWAFFEEKGNSKTGLFFLKNYLMATWAVSLISINLRGRNGIIWMGIFEAGRIWWSQNLENGEWNYFHYSEFKKSPFFVFLFSFSFLFFLNLSGKWAP